jgi:ankyrin repeat protein/branched-subunit amino acid transport protein AzlD
VYTTPTLTHRAFDPKTFELPEKLAESGQPGPSAQTQQPVHYDFAKHGDEAQFANHPDFPRFKREYEALLDGIVQFAQTHGHQVTPELQDSELAKIVDAFEQLKLNLFNPEYEQGKKYLMFGTGRDYFEQIDDLLKRNISPQKRLETVKALAGRMTVCSGGVLTEISEEITKLRCGAMGSKGAMHSVKIRMLEALINEHLQENSDFYVGRVHTVNGYFNGLATTLGIALRTDPYIKHPSEEDLERCHVKVMSKMMPTAMVKTMAEQCLNATQNAATSAGVADISAAIPIDQINKVRKAIQDAQESELNAQFGEVPAQLLLPENDTKESNTEYRVASSTAALGAHFLVDLKEKKLVNYDDTLVLSTQTPDGGQLHMLGDLFWVNTDGEYRTAELKDLLSAEPAHMMQALQPQGLTQNELHEHVNQLVAQLVALAPKGSGNEFPSAQLVEALSRLYQQTAPEPTRTLHPTVHLGLAYKECLPALKKFIEEGGNIKGADAQSYTPTMLAAEQGHCDVLKLLLPRPLTISEMNYEAQVALKIAAKNGHVEVLKLLGSWGVEVKTKNSKTPTALMLAAQYGHTEALHILVGLGAHVNAKDKFGHTALMFAAVDGHTETLNTLVSFGAQVDAKNKYGHTALMLTATDGHTEALNALASWGANLNTKDKEDHTALMFAALKGHTETVNALIQLKANPYMRNKEILGDSTALMLAAKHGHTEVVNAFVRAHETLKTPKTEKLKNVMRSMNVITSTKTQSFIDWPGRYGDTALMHAAQQGHHETVRSLLNAGADIEAADTGQMTPLALAAFKGQHETVRILLEKNANIEVEIKNGSTPLLLACAAGCTEVVKVLLAVKANLYARNKQGESALTLAAKAGNTVVVKALMQAHETLGETAQTRDFIHWADKNDQTALAHAATHKHHETVQFLCEKKADIEVRNKKGETPLMQAAKSGHVPTLTALLNTGPDLEAKDTEKENTALALAATEGQTQAVLALLEKGADINAKDKFGNTPLMFAALKNKGETVEALLGKGADIEVKNKRGCTALINAAHEGHAEIITLLIGQHAQLDATDHKAQTALMRAAYKGHTEVVRMLVDQGANTSLKCRSNYTVLKYAKVRRHTEVMNLLSPPGTRLGSRFQLRRSARRQTANTEAPQAQEN